MRLMLRQNALTGENSKPNPATHRLKNDGNSIAYLLFVQNSIHSIFQMRRFIEIIRGKGGVYKKPRLEQ